MRRKMPFSSDASKDVTVGRRLSMRSLTSLAVQRVRTDGVGGRTGANHDANLRALSESRANPVQCVLKADARPTSTRGVQRHHAIQDALGHVRPDLNDRVNIQPDVESVQAGNEALGQTWSQRIHHIPDDLSHIGKVRRDSSSQRTRAIIVVPDKVIPILDQAGRSVLHILPNADDLAGRTGSVS